MEEIPNNQLRFVVYPIIYRVLAPSKQWLGLGFLPSTAMGFHHPQAHHDFSRPSDAQKLEVRHVIQRWLGVSFGKKTPGALQRLASREEKHIPWKKGSWDPMIFLFHIWYTDRYVSSQEYQVKTEVVPLKIQIVSGCSRWSCRHACCGDMFSQVFFSKQWKYICNTSFAVGGIWGLGLVISSMKHQVSRPNIRFICMCYFQIGFWWVLHHSNMQPYQAVFGFLCRQVSVNRVLAIHFVPNFHVQRRSPDIEIKIPHWVHHEFAGG